MPSRLPFLSQLLAIVFGLVVAACGLAQQPLQKNQKPVSFERPFLIEFQGPIDQKLSRHLHSKIEIAQKAGADLVVIEVDSPGG